MKLLRLAALFLPLSAVFACFPAASIAAEVHEDVPPGISGLRATEKRPAENAVTRDMAANAAEAAARQTLRQALVRILAARPEVRFAQNPEGGSAPRIDLAALADAVVPVHVLLRSYFDSPPSVSVTVAPAEAAPDSSLPEKLRDALTHSERLELYRRAVDREKNLLKEYDALYRQQKTPRKDLTEEQFRTRLQTLAKGIEAISIYRKLLPRLDGIWRDPQAVLTATQKALALDPQNPLLHSAFGEACLQLGRSHEAMEAQTRALRLDQTFARAYHSRAVAYLALRLPALAVADFSEAVKLSPRMALYRRDRGMAYLALKDTANMCRDFYEACAFGDCEKYRWAVSHNKCSPAI